MKKKQYSFLFLIFLVAISLFSCNPKSPTGSWDIYRDMNTNGAYLLHLEITKEGETYFIELTGYQEPEKFTGKMEDDGKIILENCKYDALYYIKKDNEIFFNMGYYRRSKVQ